ncbi:MaoC family dehydratase [Microbispora sp. NPDC049125]|uniref:MaoC family dehydratase n=1 Tax=Microbispora sp. NPDC049125 TaxID=3154929 RepID=UPI003466371B
MRIFTDLAELKAAKGEHLGYTEWREITQDRVNLFADATDDHQWIHVDPARAKEGPFGATIAHGYLSLALLPSFTAELFRVDGLRMAVNYGLNKVRFPRPVPVGSRIRAGAEIADVKGTPAGTLAALKVTVEVEGETRPACVAETLSLLISEAFYASS